MVNLHREVRSEMATDSGELEKKLKSQVEQVEKEHQKLVELQSTSTQAASAADANSTGVPSYGISAFNKIKLKLFSKDLESNEGVPTRFIKAVPASAIVVSGGDSADPVKPKYEKEDLHKLWEKESNYYYKQAVKPQEADSSKTPEKTAENTQSATQSQSPTVAVLPATTAGSDSKDSAENKPTSSEKAKKGEEGRKDGWVNRVMRLKGAGGEEAEAKLFKAKLAKYGISDKDDKESDQDIKHALEKAFENKWKKEGGFGWAVKHSVMEEKNGATVVKLKSRQQQQSSARAAADTTGIGADVELFKVHKGGVGAADPASKSLKFEILKPKEAAKSANAVPTDTNTTTADQKKYASQAIATEMILKNIVNLKRAKPNAKITIVLAEPKDAAQYAKFAIEAIRAGLNYTVEPPKHNKDLEEAMKAELRKELELPENGSHIALGVHNGSPSDTKPRAAAASARRNSASEAGSAEGQPAAAAASMDDNASTSAKPQQNVEERFQALMDKKSAVAQLETHNKSRPTIPSRNRPDQ
ncbi:MAG: hypothetical protein ACKOAD_09165 [Gammaproteobacteria bacterium]